MKIKSVELFRHDLPVRGGPYKMANAEVWSLQTTLVKLTADNGLTGWGKPAPSARRTPKHIPAERRRRCSSSPPR